MSFLSQLQQEKLKLKPTETVLTLQDGQKYIESNSQMKKLNEVCLGFVVDTKPDDIPAKIIEKLYLGSQDCCELNVLENYNIKSVLSLGVKPLLTSSNVDYKFINMLDLNATDLRKYLPECISFINEGIGKDFNVLVHCNAGVSRSASVVISYLIIQHKLTFDKAFEVVKEARPCIRPNDGFMAQLRHLKCLD